MRVRKTLSLLAVVAFVGCADQPTVPPDVDVQFNATGTAADKTVLCHKPGTPAEGTLEVATAAVEAHLGHGDVLGECTGGGPGDACTAINDPGLDGTGISEVHLYDLVFVGDEKVTLRATDWSWDGQPFSIFVRLSPDYIWGTFDNSYWYPGAAFAQVILPDCRFSEGRSCGLGGWRDYPLYLGWGTLETDLDWEVSCEHVPF